MRQQGHDYDKVHFSRCFCFCPLWQRQPLVENLTNGTGYETIAEAIEHASPGDHLELSANTFVERVNISIPLVISGSEMGGTIIDVSEEIGWGITLNADNITLEDIVILAGGTNTEYAVHSEPGITGLTLDNVVVIIRIALHRPMASQDR